MPCKIASWNLCLGLQSKKIMVKEEILKNKIDICCMQETDIQNDYPTNILTFPGYQIEVETNDVKGRVAIYVAEGVKYVRRQDLEGTNSNMIIMDIKLNKTLRIINMYRSFNPQNNVNPREKFIYQLDLIKNAMTQNTILLGDFNLDNNKKFCSDYVFKNLFEDMNNALGEYNLIQLVEFDTWFRLVENVLKKSTLDHVYVNDATMVSRLEGVKPNFGDHLLVSFAVDLEKEPPVESTRRDWRKYSATKLCERLGNMNWLIGIENVQEYWNVFENMLINVIDTIAPLVTFVNDVAKETKPPPHIKNAINTRQRILKNYRKHPCLEIKIKIGILDKTIRDFFKTKKTSRVRNGILPGNSKTLWRAVNIAKDINPPKLHSEFIINNLPIPRNNAPDAFADFFSNKVITLTNEAKVNENVYNGKLKVQATVKNFMTYDAIMECLKSIKIKNCEGYDRIPQRILADGAIHLVSPLKTLLDLVYTHNEIPEQWLIAKVTPIHKKGPKNDVSNYRPVSNLCSTTKLFEKLIMKRIIEIESENKTDLTGVEQHGFKKCKSTASAGLVIQSILSRAVDSNNYALMASIDLSAAFDLVNTNLLIKRLKIIGLPLDVIRLIKLWLSKRSFYVEINGVSSLVVDLIGGTIQGSILGPLLYAIYVSPLFDMIRLTNFADDNFVIRRNRYLEALIQDLKKDLETMTKWLKDSGLKVNESKTELCLFHRLDSVPISLTLNDIEIFSKPSMNVLGILFDSKLQWSPQVNQCIKKSLKALHAIRLIKSHFKETELKQLVTSNFYSILYYNSEVWHLPSLNKFKNKT